MRSSHLLVFFTFACGISNAQISNTAYRVLGQPDLRQNGLNQVQGNGFNSPSALCLFASGIGTHIYISDTDNSRVLGWNDVNSYQTGDPPGIILGQSGPAYWLPLGIGVQGLQLPTGVAVDPATGNVYVADSGNNRIARFADPFLNPGSNGANAIIGQPGFTTNAAGTTQTTLRQPQAVAFDPAGNLWVVDTGNNRVLRFPAAVLDGRTSPVADIVIGQKDFVSRNANQGGNPSATGLNSPRGIAFDSLGNLYVSDFNNARVLQYVAPFVVNQAAVEAIGQINLTSAAVQPASAATFAGPAGLR